MPRRFLVACAIALALKSLPSEIFTFKPWIDASLVGGILSNLVLLVVFAELYWHVDQEKDFERGGQHFGFESALDAYYYSTVTSSSVGYGDFLPRTPKAKMLTMIHIVSVFFVMLPVILKALENAR